MVAFSSKGTTLPKYVILDFSENLKRLERVFQKNEAALSFTFEELLGHIFSAISFEHRALTELDCMLFELFSDSFSITITEEMDLVKRYSLLTGNHFYERLLSHQLYINGYVPYCFEKIVGSSLYLSLNEVWVESSW